MILVSFFVFVNMESSIELLIVPSIVHFLSRDFLNIILLYINDMLQD
jgi:hypothetical protein